MDYVLFLRQHIENVLSLTDEEFEEVKKHFVAIKVPKKEILLQCNEPVTKEYLVLKGCMKLFTFDEDGKEYIIQFAMENWWISDYPAYQSQVLSTTCIQALEDCIILELLFSDKEILLERVPKMQIFFGKKSFGGYVALQKRVLSMLKNSAKEKYELLLSQYPELFQRVSKTMIAHYLGVSRETLSRLHKK